MQHTILKDICIAGDEKISTQVFQTITFPFTVWWTGMRFDGERVDDCAWSTSVNPSYGCQAYFSATKNVSGPDIRLCTISDSMLWRVVPKGEHTMWVLCHSGATSEDTGECAPVWTIEGIWHQTPLQKIQRSRREIWEKWRKKRFWCCFVFMSMDWH